MMDRFTFGYLDKQLNILREVSDERERQDQQWGGPECDDKFCGGHWVDAIDNQICKISENIRYRSEFNGVTLTTEELENYRKCMINIAALAVAAVESYDRKYGKKNA